MKKPLRFTSFLLIAANIIPLIGVSRWGWSIFDVVLLYWAENVIIGVFHLLKLATLYKKGEFFPLLIEKVFFLPFFAVHYGGFCAVHGLFVLDLLGDGASMKEVPGILLGQGLRIAFYALVISHGVSFVINQFFRKEYIQGSVGKIMMQPYGRVVVLHIVILAGAFAIQIFGAKVFMLVLLVIGKIVLDVLLHVRTHRKALESAEKKKAEDETKRTL